MRRFFRATVTAIFLMIAIMIYVMFVTVAEPVAHVMI